MFFSVILGDNQQQRSGVLGDSAVGFSYTNCELNGSDLIISLIVA